MKPIIYAILAVVLYACSNVIMELKLSKYQALTTLVMTGGTVFISSFLVRLLVKGNDPSYDFPMDSGLLWAIGACLIFAIADYFYIDAYVEGGDLLTITSIVIFFPAVAATMKFVVTGRYPNMWQVAGFLVMVCGVLLMAKGVATTAASAQAAAPEAAPASTS